MKSKPKQQIDTSKSLSSFLTKKYEKLDLPPEDIELLKCTILNKNEHVLNFSSYETLKHTFSKFVESDESLIYHHISKVYSLFKAGNYITEQQYYTIRDRPKTVSVLMAYKEAGWERLFKPKFQVGFDCIDSTPSTSENEASHVASCSSSSRNEICNYFPPNTSSEREQSNSIKDGEVPVSMEKRQTLASTQSQDESTLKEVNALSEIHHECMPENVYWKTILQTRNGESSANEFSSTINSNHLNEEKEAVDNSSQDHVFIQHKESMSIISDQSEANHEEYKKKIDKQYAEMMNCSEERWKFVIMSLQDITQMMKEDRLLRAELKQDMDELKQDMDGLKQDIKKVNKNVGTLYELNVLQVLKQKYPNSSIASPKNLPFVPGKVDEQIAKDWKVYLGNLVFDKKISPEDAKCLSLENVTTVECNFIIEEGTNFKIIEATLSSFHADVKLTLKLLQLERQVLAFNMQTPKRHLVEIGLISPSGVDVDEITKIVKEHARKHRVMTNVLDFITKKQFYIGQCGSKLELC